MAENVRSIRRAKNTYTLKDGTKIPGVTTVLRLRAKEALVEWAFNLGKDNPQLSSSRAYVDDLAKIGTLTHELIGAHLRNETPDLSDFTPREVEAAQIPYAKYLSWEQGKKIEVEAIEKVVISERYRYGGSLDVRAKIDGKRTVMDFKTGKAIYPDYFIQTAAYAEAEQEQTGDKIDQCLILQIGRTGEEGFGEGVRTDWRNEFWQFLALRALYDIERHVEFCKKYPGSAWDSRPVASWFTPRAPAALEV